MPRPGAPGVELTVAYEVVLGSTTLPLGSVTDTTRVYSRPSCSMAEPTHT